MKNNLNISKALSSKIEKLLSEYNLMDWDWGSYLDGSLTDEENYNRIEEECKKLNPSVINEMPSEEEINEKNAENLVKYVEELNGDLEQSIQNMRDNTTSIIDQRFSTIDDNIEILAGSSRINGYIIEGEPAIGKSQRAVQKLSRMNLKSNEGYIVLQSHITALEFYEYLYKNNGKIIVCDDVLKLFKDEIKQGLLLSALWNPTGRRIVEYYTSSSKLKVPPKFEFTGKMIIICNKLPKDLDSLKTRCLYEYFKFTTKEKIEIIYEICKIEGIPMEIFDFIKTNCDESVNNLNFRLPIKLYEIYKAKHDKWIELATIQLEIDEKVKIAGDLFKSGKKREEMLSEWTTKTKLQQSQMYNYMNTFKERAGLEEFMV